MPKTAKRHFDEDIERAQAIADHAKSIIVRNANDGLLRDDLFRSAWMFAVGAMDAYFCDAYGDLVARTLRAKSLQDTVELRSHILKVEIPVSTMLARYASNENWRWRMAARHMIEKDSVLSVSQVRNLFNGFCRQGHKLGDNTTIDSWIALAAGSGRRVFGIDPAAYLALSSSDKNKQRGLAKEHMADRYERIAQRRHDCIHNCDRPKVKPQQNPWPAGVRLVIRDVRFLVERCDAHFDTQFRSYLKDVGCNAGTLNQVLQQF